MKLFLTSILSLGVLACSASQSATAPDSTPAPAAESSAAQSGSTPDAKPAAATGTRATQASAAKPAAADGGSGPAPAADGSSAAPAADSGSSAAPAAGSGSSAAPAGDHNVSSAAGSSAGHAGQPARAGSAATIGLDGGVDTKDALMGTESCCMVHDSKGCTNGQLQACVCAKLPNCCTGTWTAECVDYVMHKNCQAGVRDCVCGSADGQWQQTDCCQKTWGSTCDTVAESKCGATRGCF